MKKQSKKERDFDRLRRSEERLLYLASNLFEIDEMNEYLDSKQFPARFALFVGEENDYIDYSNVTVAGSRSSCVIITADALDKILERNLCNFDEDADIEYLMKKQP